MTAATRMRRPALLAGALGAWAALALCGAGNVMAAATVVCAAPTLTITIGPGPPATTTVVASPTEVVVNGTPYVCGDPLNIVIDGDGDPNVVTYSGAPGFTLVANLGGGDDDFTASGAQPVEVNGGSGDDTLRGAAGADTLRGDGGDDVLRGGPAADTLEGGTAGPLGDTASYAERSTEVIASVTGGGEDTFTSIENLTGGGGDDELVGDGGANVLDGGGGDDLLRPGEGGGANLGGADGTPGGANGDGGDIVSFDGVGVEVTASLPGAIATGAGGLSQGLVGIENLTGGSADDTLVGDAGPNVLRGGDGDDLLRPGGGGGASFGGAHGTPGGAHGDSGDIVSFEDVVIDVTASIPGGSASGAGLSQTLSDVENLTGGGGDDTLVGDGGANVLDGGGGDDLLRPAGGGGSNAGGADGTPGGAHGDTGDSVSYEDVAVEVTADLVAGSATGAGGLSQTLASVENLTGGPADDTLVGNGGANVLDGGGGDDLLRPAGGGGSNVGGTHGTAGGAHGDGGDTRQLRGRRGRGDGGSGGGHRDGRRWSVADARDGREPDRRPGGRHARRQWWRQPPRWRGRRRPAAPGGWRRVERGWDAWDRGWRARR